MKGGTVIQTQAPREGWRQLAHELASYIASEPDLPAARQRVLKEVTRETAAITQQARRHVAERYPCVGGCCTGRDQASW